MLKPRLITPRELADLPQNWINHSLDGQESKYYKSCFSAWEVCEGRHQLALDEGVCCQVVGGRYYIGQE